MPWLEPQFLAGYSITLTTPPTMATKTWAVTPYFIPIPYRIIVLDSYGWFHAEVLSCVFTYKQTLKTNRTNRARTNKQNEQIFCPFDVFVAFAVFSQFPDVCAIHHLSFSHFKLSVDWYVCRLILRQVCNHFPITLKQVIICCAILTFASVRYCEKKWSLLPLLPVLVTAKPCFSRDSKCISF